jgi:hypothetical protein
MASCLDVAGKMQIRRNNAYNREVTFSDSDEQPINLTGYTIYYAIKKDIDKITDDDATITGELIIDPDQATNTGKALFSLTAAQTVTMPLGTYFIDFRVFNELEVLIGNTTLINVQVVPIATQRNV